MNGYNAFIKKEFIESIKTYKIIILLAVFFLFGMISPLTAKLMPEIFKSLSVEGISITLPPPVATDSYAQFFKNTTQLGILVVLLVFSGMLSTEISKGTLINVMTKGLSRNAVILSKFTVSSILWTVSLLLSFLTAYGYTVYLFGNEQIPNLIFSVFCFWVFGLFLLAFILFSSSFIPGSFGGLSLTAVVIIILMILNSFSLIRKFNPLTLSTYNLQLLTGSFSVKDMILPLILTIFLTFACLWISLVLFKKRKL